jgi:hypothetical protein
LVNDATELVARREKRRLFVRSGSRAAWRDDIFVLDLDGMMLVHADPAMEGRTSSNWDIREAHHPRPDLRGDGVT